MVWHLDGLDYHSEGLPSEAAKAAVDPRITLVYWDYYQNEEALYADALYKHAQFPVPTVFAGGIWTWTGPAPAYRNAIENSVAGLSAAIKAGIPMALATAWGDNGAETNFTAGLLALQLYGEMAYTGEYNEAALHARFRRCCGADAQAFLALGELNIVPGMKQFPSNPVNACKFLLYQDPLIQLFEKDMEGFDLSGHYSALVQRFARYAQENPDYRLLFDFYTALAHALALKCRWHEQAGNVVRSGNRGAAAALAEDIPATVDALHTLRSIWRNLWESTNKPHGFEVIEVRLGGVAARMQTAGEKMRAFAAGEVETIPELVEECLITKRRPDNSVSCTNVMGEIATASTIDW